MHTDTVESVVMKKEPYKEKLLSDGGQPNRILTITDQVSSEKYRIC